jgi:ATP synthase protein I
VPLFIEGKPIRTVLRWQLYATAASMLTAAFWSGTHGALSALLGGLINIAAGTVFGLVATHSRKRTAGEALIALMRAEASKVALIVVQLWLVLVYYKALMFAPFFGTFFLTVIFFSMAIFVRERDKRAA